MVQKSFLSRPDGFKVFKLKFQRHFGPSTLYPRPSTIYPRQFTLDPRHFTLDPQPSTKTYTQFHSALRRTRPDSVTHPPDFGAFFTDSFACSSSTFSFLFYFLFFPFYFFLRLIKVTFGAFLLKQLFYSGLPNMK